MEGAHHRAEKEQDELRGTHGPMWALLRKGDMCLWQPVEGR